MVSIIKMAATSKTPVRASGKGHMWYDTVCVDDNDAVIIQTEGVHSFSDFELTVSEG